MDKKKQIEEMAKYCCGCCEMSWGCDDGDCAEKGEDGYKNCGLAKGTAEKLYNAGYRKIPEVDCVLTNDDVAELLTIVARDTRKETVEKIADWLDNEKGYCGLGYLIKRQFLTEGK